MATPQIPAPADVTRLVLQWLHERGYEESCRQLQRESHCDYKPEQFDEGGRLMTILNDWQDMENLRLSAMNPESTDAAVTREMLLRLGTAAEGADEDADQRHSCQIARRLEVHSGNVLCVRFAPTAVTDVLHSAPVIVASASSDKTVAITNAGTGDLLHHFADVHSAGVLSVDWHPAGEPWLMSCGMDGKHALLCARTGATLQTWHEHRKYVTRAQFSPTGRHFVTTSYDHALCVFERVDATDDGTVSVNGAPAVVATSTTATATATSTTATVADTPTTGTQYYRLRKRVEYPANVEAIEFSKDGARLIVAVRDDNYLHYYALTPGDGAATPANVTVADDSATAPIASTFRFFAEERVNLNSNGDDHVSFAVLHMTRSPDGQMLLCSTDTDRLILMRLGTGVQLRNFFGANNNGFSQPRHSWSHCGRFIYSTSPEHKVFVWSVRTGKVVAAVGDAHKATIRDVHYHPEHPLFATASFDRSIVVYAKDK